MSTSSQVIWNWMDRALQNAFLITEVSLALTYTCALFLMRETGRVCIASLQSEIRGRSVGVVWFGDYIAQSKIGKTRICVWL
ncbi:hypothetical protein EJ02DRAFT_117077 [Clathrospora elynae]|uniref:Uncharacterized protein n=1 Tax=Clathrospora elynae TaxID=706981 RepID=A0A6A5S7D1_9PLEO|nr:hypothetical protein EJ02DRAFT_117077 [Clathrospora elynae]